MQPTWLYRVTTDTQPSYVFAALDDGCPLHDSFPSDYTPLFQFARLVIVEQASTEEEAEEAMTTHGVDRSGSLARTLGAERFATLAETIHGAIEPALVPYLRPPYALAYLSLTVSADAYGGHMTDGRMSPLHDAVSRRRMNGGTLLGLYEDDEVERARVALARPATEALIACLDHLDVVRAQARERLAAYRAGDQDALVRVHGERLPGGEAFETLGQTLSDRVFDAHWDRLQTELRAGNAFAVLPTSDVLGDHGVLARLRNSGVEITRISVAAPVP